MEDKQEEKKEKPETKSTKMPLMIGGGILILVIILAGSFSVMKSVMAPANAQESEDVEQVDQEGEETYKTTGVYFREFDAFITVLKPSEDYHFTYLKFVPQFEVSDQKTLGEITLKLPSIDAKISAVMTDLDWDSVKSERGRERQAEKLRVKLNEMLESGEIIRVYFTNFVAQ